MLRNWLSSLIFILLPVGAWAGQMISIANNGEGVAQIARAALNRIYIQDDQVSQITSLNGELLIQKDTQNGQLFIKPLEESREKPIEVFISTEKGNHFSLSLKPLTVKAQNIGLVLAEKIVKQQSKEENIIAVIKEMEGIEVELNQYLEKSILSAQPQAVHFVNFHEAKYEGKIFIVANNDTVPQKVNLNSYWEEGVIAVAVEKSKLLEGEATKVFVVKNHA